MQTKHQRLAVVLDEAAANRVEQAAQLTGLSPTAFVEQAAAEAARQVLIDAIAADFEKNERSMSELAAETGLAVEEIIEGMAVRSGDAGLETFLASSRALAEERRDPDAVIGAGGGRRSRSRTDQLDRERR